MAATTALSVAALGFGPLFSSQTTREKVAIDAAEMCRQQLGHTLGREWMECVINELSRVQEAANAAGSRSYFPVENDEIHRLWPAGRRYGRSDELMNILRNFSCEVADGGSQPVRSFEWTFRPPDPCAAHEGGAAGADGGQRSRFVYSAGFLPAGNDLRSASLSVSQAQAACDMEEACAGFTLQAADDPTARAADDPTRHSILFKSSAEGHSPADGWHTWRKLRVLDCSAEARARRSAPMTLTVQVLRESPPVYVVDDFVSDAECDSMLHDTLPKMGRSVVGGGGTSNWRQSYSVNMVPDFEYEDHLITRIARRKFAFAREVAKYDVVEGEGQEPVNAVYYKDDGDQYRPHCDGECNGNAYTLGARVASSLAYCAVAERGGYTLFTRVGLKVVPKKRQLLFFGYFFNESGVGIPMDNGHTEHTGCPLREGRKWIATMWYREGVTKAKDWAYWSRFGRAGV